MIPQSRLWRSLNFFPLGIKFLRSECAYSFLTIDHSNKMTAFLFPEWPDLTIELKIVFSGVIY